MVYNNEIIDDSDFNKFESVKVRRKFLNFRNVSILILTFVMAMQSFNGLSFNVLPFIMLGVSGVFNLPLILVFISGILGMIFNNSINNSMYILFSIYFIVFSIFTSILNIEGISRKYVGLIKMSISLIITLIIGVMFFNISFVNLIYITLTAGILFPVFVSGIYVIFNINKGFVFSNEEMVSMLCVLSFGISLLFPLKIYNISIMNIIATIIIMIFGWKNGAILGTVSGFLIGIIMAITKDLSLTYVITLAFSGLISGIFSRLGKVAVIIGFIVGFIIISVTMKTSAFFNTNLIEILISSIALLFLPKKLSFSLDKLFNINNKLNYNEINYLDVGKNVKDKLDAASDVFSDLADITLPITNENKLETREVIRKYILHYAKENFIAIDLNDNGEFDKFVDNICSKLENLEEINIDDFKSYFDSKQSAKILKSINEIYSNMKITRLLKKKEEDNTNNLSKQYKEVSKVIENISKNIVVNVPSKFDKNIKNIREELKLAGFHVYEDEIINIKNYIEYTFVTDILTDIDRQRLNIVNIVSNILERPMKIKLLLNISKLEQSKIKLVSKSNFEINTSTVQDNKMSEIVNGDSYSVIDADRGKYITILSDGVGSSDEAYKSSRNTIKMIEKLIKGGFEENNAISIANLIIKMREDENSFSTLDIMIADLEKGLADFIKLRCSSNIYNIRK